MPRRKRLCGIGRENEALCRSPYIANGMNGTVAGVMKLLRRLYHGGQGRDWWCSRRCGSGRHAQRRRRCGCHRAWRDRPRNTKDVAELGEEKLIVGAFSDAGMSPTRMKAVVDSGSTPRGKQTGVMAQPTESAARRLAKERNPVCHVVARVPVADAPVSEEQFQG